MLALPDLQPWHRFAPGAELTAGVMDERFTLEQDLAREAAVFAEVHDRVERRSSPTETPDRRQPLRPPQPISTRARAGRGLEPHVRDVPPGDIARRRPADSRPHRLALQHARGRGDTLKASGYLRSWRCGCPGTAPCRPASPRRSGRTGWPPSGVGDRHVRQRIGPGKPLVLVGYSNGGALVLNMRARSARARRSCQRPRLVLISPMIGVARFARLARVISPLGPIPYLREGPLARRHARSTTPSSTTRFPRTPAQSDLPRRRPTCSRNPARQGQRRLKACRRCSRSSRSSTPRSAPTRWCTRCSISSGEPARARALRHQPVLRARAVHPAGGHGARRQPDGGAARLRRSLVTNAAGDRSTCERSIGRAAVVRIVTRPLGLAWPPEMFSLSHVALPFPPDDPVYGTMRRQSADQSPSDAEPARRARGADGAAGHADADRMQPVLSVHGPPDR